MAKDDHERDAAVESARLLSESPPPIEDGQDLVVHKRSQHPLASHPNLNESSLLPASSPTPSTLIYDASPDPSLPNTPATAPNASPRPMHARRQSSFAQHRPDGTPRTPNRVRFEVDDREVGTNTPTSPHHPQLNGFPRGANGHARHSLSDSSWLQEEDYLTSPIDGTLNGLGSGRRRESGGQRVPLLTDIEAPSVTVATPGAWEEGEEETDLREVMVGGGRTKSGMRSAFMNMANSIMYVVPVCSVL